VLPLLCRCRDANVDFAYDGRGIGMADILSVSSDANVNSSVVAYRAERRFVGGIVW